MAGCQAAPARQEKYLVRAPHTPCNEYQNGKDQRKVHIFTFFGRFVQPRWRRCASLPYSFVLSASARLASAAVRNAYLYLSSTCKTAKKASWGISTRPTCFIRFLPAFCFSSNFFF